MVVQILVNIGSGGLWSENTKPLPEFPSVKFCDSHLAISQLSA